MSPSKVEQGGSSRNRRNQRRHTKGIPVSNDKPENEKVIAHESKYLPNPEAQERRNELLHLIGISLGLASWGYTILVPESGYKSGTVLLFASVVVILFGIWRVWRYSRIWFSTVVLVVMTGFVAFDWFVIIRPERGKPFRDLLVEGYHLTNECQSIPANEEMPSWIRDQSKEWQSRVQQLIGERLSATDAQTWQNAMVIGTVNDERTNGYQCLWLGNKVSALEKIVATNFQASLQHREQITPTFWLDAVDGEVDMTPVLNSGIQGPGVYINGGGIGMVKVKGKAPFKNGTVKFQLQTPP